MTKYSNKKCIFCAGSRLSKQHVFPDWIKKILPRKQIKHERLFYNFLRNPLVKSEIVSPNILSRVNGDISSRKIKNVCLTCNNGWMSAIEGRVKPFLAEMFLGKTTTLDDMQSGDLVKWIVMTTIMAEFTDPAPRNWAISENDRRLLFQGDSVYKNWKIWIGRLDHQLDTIHYSHTAALVHGKIITPEMIERPLSIPTNCQSSTYVIGQFFVHAVSGPDYFLDAYNLKDHKDKLIQISPQINETISWPPFLRLSNSETTEIQELLRKI